MEAARMDAEHSSDPARPFQHQKSIGCYATGKIFHDQGVTVCYGMLLSTGCSTAYNRISPDTVLKARLEGFNIPPLHCFGANGSRYTRDTAVKFDLTFAGITKTLEAVVDDSHGGYSVLLGLQGLHAFGISIDTFTLPATVSARQSLTVLPKPIALDALDVSYAAENISSEAHELDDYIKALLLDGSFEKDDLPPIAWDNLANYSHRDLVSHFNRLLPQLLAQGARVPDWVKAQTDSEYGVHENYQSKRRRTDPKVKNVTKALPQPLFGLNPGFKGINRGDRAQARRKESTVVRKNENAVGQGEKNVVMQGIGNVVVHGHVGTVVMQGMGNVEVHGNGAAIQNYFY